MRATSKEQNDVVYLSAAASCFLRLVLLNGTRDKRISVKDLSKYELAPLPFALCNPILKICLPVGIPEEVTQQVYSSGDVVLTRTPKISIGLPVYSIVVDSQYTTTAAVMSLTKTMRRQKLSGRK